MFPDSLFTVNTMCAMSWLGFCLTVPILPMWDAFSKNLRLSNVLGGGICRGQNNALNRLVLFDHSNQCVYCVAEWCKALAVDGLGAG